MGRWDHILDQKPQDIREYVLDKVAEQLAEPMSHRECRMQRALRMVLLGRWCPERCHDGVSHELLDGATDGLDLGGHRVVEAVEHRSGPFRVLRGSQLGGADQVGEQDRGDIPLFHAPSLNE